MESVRPLVTITILAVVGAWLYVKINEGPARPELDEPAAWQGDTAAAPPLAETGAATPSANTSAPPQPTASDLTPASATIAESETTAPMATSSQPAPSTAGTSVLPDMPAIPELPDAAATADAPPTAAPSAPPTALPAEIPQARYPDQPTDIALATSPSSAEVAQTITPDNLAAPSTAATSAAPSVAAPSATAADDEHENIAAANSGMARVGLAPQEPATSPLTPSDNHYDSNAPVSNPYATAPASAPTQSPAPAATSPAKPTFASAWPEIQAALHGGQLARALELLSKWYGDDSLTAAEAEQVNTLVSQLAGTVVYSNEHRLEPARLVRAGETLESIAAEFNVPWQLLAKINGIPSAHAAQPGQQLKVMRGPFSGIVELGRSQLVLMLGGRYAGNFPITLAPGTTLSEGEWLVGEKLVVPTTSGAQASYVSAQATVNRAIVLRGEEAGTGKPAASGPTLVIASAATPVGPAASAPAIRVSPQDAEELSDILSVGSRITVRR